MQLTEMEKPTAIIPQITIALHGTDLRLESNVPDPQQVAMMLIAALQASVGQLKVNKPAVEIARPQIVLQ